MSTEMENRVVQLEMNNKSLEKNSKQSIKTLEKLDNGIRVVMERMDGCRSVAIGAWVKAGSVDENSGENGITHFIEHMLFKGTSSRSAKDIAVEMDAVGGNLNAFTAKECTCFYANILDEHVDLAVDVLITERGIYAKK